MTRSRPAQGSWRNRFALTLLARVVGAILQTATIALLARQLGVESFGLFAVTAAIAMAVMAFSDLGMATATLATSPNARNRQFVATTIYLKSAAGILMVASATLLAHLTNSQDSALAIATTSYIASETLGDLAVIILQSEKKARMASGVLLIRRCVPVLALTVQFTQSPSIAALILTSAANMSALALVARKRIHGPPALRKYLAEHWRTAVTVSGRNLATMDTAVVGLAAGVTTAGLYGAATRLGNPANLAITTLVQVTIPELAGSADDNAKKTTFNSTRRIVLLGGTFVGASALFAPYITRAILGDDFAPAAPAVAAVLIAAGVSAITQIYMSWFFATRLTNLIVTSAPLVGLLGLGMVAAAANYFGAGGAGAALIVWRLTTLAIVLASWRSVNQRYSP